MKKSGAGSFIGKPPPSSEIFIAMSQGIDSQSSDSDEGEPKISDSKISSFGVFMACDQFSSQ